MRARVVVGNWKMNGRHESIDQLVKALVKGLKPGGQVEVVVCPSSIYIYQVCSLIEGSLVLLGAQNMSEHDDGAYTGELSAGMLKDHGCRYVVLGHSERRSLFGETDELVAEKVKVALAVGLTPILCVGETLNERESGSTLAVVSRQVRSVIDLVGVTGVSQSLVAYEPVWAIGTGETATPAQAQEVHLAIRRQVGEIDKTVADELRILYGGSVKADNAEELFGQPDIDGGLIGGASLRVDEFLSICAAAEMN
ncbi:MAG: triose-phosphate isomerase [Pseudomonadales bacterium]|nr:triose-phosphate isomerase [Pseudomonadales bacterium]